MAPVKLGPHVMRFTDAARAWSEQAPIVKAVDGVQALTVTRPGIPTVYRRVFLEFVPEVGGFREVQDISRSGDDIVAEILDNMGDVHPEYVELFNGPLIDQPGVLDEWIRINREGASALHRYGFKCAGFSFYTGWPPRDAWMKMAENGYSGVDVIALGQYWGDAGYTLQNALHHRQLHEWVGGDHPRFIITECGRDEVEGGGRGWKRSGVSAEQYAVELLTYDALLSQDSYVIGGCVFTAGPDYNWPDFDTDGLLPLLGIVPPIVTPPITPPVTPPTPVAPAARRVPLSTVALGAAALAVFGYGIYQLASSEEE